MRGRTAAVAGIGTVAAVTLLVLAAVLGTWTDEEYTLATTAFGPARAFERALRFELQAPLYFTVLAAWRELSGGVFFARLFSVIAACTVGPLLAILAYRLRPEANVAPLALFVALSPFVVFAGVEIRLYAWALALVAALLLAFYDGFFRDRPAARVVFVGLALAATYVQYYLAFALVGCGVALLVAGRGRSLIALVACAVPIALGMAPILGFIGPQIAGTPAASHASLALARIAIDPFFDFLFPHEWATTPRAVRLWEGIVLLCAVGLAALRPKIDRTTAAFVAIPCVVLALFVALTLITRVQLEIPRHLVGLYPPLVLAAWLVASSPVRAGRVPLRRALVGTAFACAAASLLARYHSGAKTGDWPRVGAYLDRHVQPGQRVAVFEIDAVLPLARYSAHPARLVPVPVAPPHDRYDAGILVVRDDAAFARALAPLVDASGRLWLVEDHACVPRPDPLYGCAHLAAVVARDYEICGEADFFESRVLELRRRRATTTSSARRASAGRGTMSSVGAPSARAASTFAATATP